MNSSPCCFVVLLGGALYPNSTTHEYEWTLNCELDEMLGRGKGVIHDRDGGENTPTPCGCFIQQQKKPNLQWYGLE